MRLFIAVDISDAVRERLSQLLAQLKHSNSDVRWVRPESLHVTLKFLGEQAESRVEPLGARLAAICSPGPFQFSLRGLGCFPNERRPRVFWVGVEAPPQLAELARLVDEAVEPLGLEREKRPYSAHLTLGRAREGGPPPVPGPVWEKHAADEFGTAAANQFFLYRSELMAGGAQYTRLRAFPL
jgi:2'-5' RNA ligase